jgi:hypothetical protein
MTISRTQLDQALSEPEINKFWLGYFQEGFRAEIYAELLEMYEHWKHTKHLSRSDLARKIGRRPEQVTRWLSAPANLEADTISDMALGMGFVPRIHFEPVSNVFSVGKPNLTNPVSDFVSTANTASQAALVTVLPNQAYQPQGDVALSVGP